MEIGDLKMDTPPKGDLHYGTIRRTEDLHPSLCQKRGSLVLPEDILCGHEYRRFFEN